MICPAKCEKGLQENNEGIKVTCPVCEGRGHVPDQHETNEDQGQAWINENAGALNQLRHMKGGGY